MRAHTLSVSERGTTPALALRSIHISSVRAEICIHGKRTYNTYHVILSHNTSSYHISHHPITYHIILSHRAEICIHGKRVYVDHQLQFLLSEYMSLRYMSLRVYAEHLSIRVYVDHQLQFLLS